MALYMDKGTEELRAILETYKQNSKAKTGQEPTNAELKKKLQELLDTKKEALFKESFGTMTVKNMQQLIDLLGKASD